MGFLSRSNLNRYSDMVSFLHMHPSVFAIYIFLVFHVSVRMLYV